jgi:hypothetical protein
MKYINKNTGDSISVATYNNLNPSAQINFTLDVSTSQPQTTHQIIETKSDSLSVGDAVALVALTPLIILKSIF